MARGHTLLLPKEKAATIDILSSTSAAALFSHVPRIARAVQAATGADGINVLQNNGAAAGQVRLHSPRAIEG